MGKELMEMYYNQIPIGKANAVDYPKLCAMWKVSIRTVRAILHELSLYDNGDDYVLIRSSKTKGFYKTDDKDEIAAYRKECLNKGRSVFAPVKKCNRILKGNKAVVRYGKYITKTAFDIEKGDIFKCQIGDIDNYVDCVFEGCMIDDNKTAILYHNINSSERKTVYDLRPFDRVTFNVIGREL